MGELPVLGIPNISDSTDAVPPGMKAKYCFWSVADGPYGAMMENCVRTAREAGVFKEFHVLTDRPLAGCECYDAFQFEKANGLFKLHYLKVGMSRLNFDYFVWLDADTVFLRNPVDVLAPLGRSPLHVPLEVNLSALNEDRVWKDSSLFRLRDLLREQGVMSQAYLCGSAFWIVHHDAIDTVYELALGFWRKARESGLIAGVSAALGYAMQILCANPEAHLLEAHPELWASDDMGRLDETFVKRKGAAWAWQHPLRSEAIEVRPAMVHLPRSKESPALAISTV
ncbi:MAG: hypothetical protein AAB676_05725 [Verrucomicrobiota bacterium]